MHEGSLKINEKIRGTPCFLRELSNTGEKENLCHIFYCNGNRKITLTTEYSFDGEDLKGYDSTIYIYIYMCVFLKTTYPENRSGNVL